MSETGLTLHSGSTEPASALDEGASVVERVQSATPYRGALHPASQSSDRLVAALVVVVEQAHANRDEAAATLPSSSGLGTE